MRTRSSRGLTLLEVIIVVFIFLVGVMGVLAALPTGVQSAETVILQDAAIHLAHSKFSEFRRDAPDYAAFAGYLSTYHESPDASGWRSFASGAGDTYEHFDDITHYQWKAECTPVFKDPKAQPNHKGGQPLGLFKVTITVRLQSTVKEFQFSQYMTSVNDS
jgi:prepilin-type N-terminal cleavage/methylation domain-containing protein